MASFLDGMRTPLWWRRAWMQQPLSLPTQCLIVCFLSVSMCSCLLWSARKYSCQLLFHTGRKMENNFSPAKSIDIQTILETGLLSGLELLGLPTALRVLTVVSCRVKRRCKHCEIKLKRRLFVRLADSSNSQTAVPTILLANVPSIDNKIGTIHLLRTIQCDVRDCCVLLKRGKMKICQTLLFSCTG